MTISVAGTRPVSTRGFTLVELLVVLIVLALVSGIVLTSLPARQSEAMRAAHSLSALSVGLSDSAVLEGRAYGLEVSEGVLMLYSYDGEEWRRRPLPRDFTLDDDIFLSLTTSDEFDLPEEEDEGEFLFRARDGVDEEEEDRFRPSVVFGPAGDQTPFTLRISDRNEAVLLDVSGLNGTEVRHAEP